MSGFNVGAITSELKLEKAGWDKAVQGVKKDQKSMADFAKKHGDAVKKVGRTFTVVGAGIVGSLGLMVKKYVETGDAIDKMSKRTGFSATKLSELAYAADISGASLDDVEKGAKRMASAIIDAEDGLMETKRAFDKLGLSTKEIIDMKPEDQFSIIAEAIAKVESPTMRAALAQDVFGRAGTKLLPLFAEGEKGLAALSREAHELGIIFDTEAAAKAAKLKDEQTALKESFKGVGFALAETIIPAITKAVRKITEIIKKVTAWMKEHPKLIAWITKTIAKLGVLMLAMGPILMILPKIIIGFQTLKKLQLGTKIASGFKAMLSPMGLVTAAIALVVAGIIKTINHFKKIKEIEANLRKFDTAAGRSAGFLRKFYKEGEKYADQLIYFSDQVLKKYKGDVNAALEALAQGTMKRSKRMKELRNVLLGMQKVEKGLAEEREKIAGQEVELQKRIQKYARESVEKKKEAAKKILELSKTLVNEIKKASLDEYKYRVWAAEQTYKERMSILDKAKADKKDYVLVEKGYALELKKIEDDRLAHEKDTKEKNKKVWTDFFDKVKEKHENFKGFIAGYTNIIKSYTLDEFTYKIDQLGIWVAAEYAKLKESKLNIIEYYKARKLLDEAYTLKREEIEEARAANQKEIEEQELEDSKIIMDEKLRYWKAMADAMLDAMGRFFEALLLEKILFRNAERKELQEWYEEEKEYLRRKYGDSKEFYEKLAELNAEMAERTRKLEEEKAGWLKRHLKLLWADIKKAFAKVISDMIKEYLTNFVKKIIAKSKDVNTAMSKTSTAFDKVGTSVAGLGKGLGELIAGLAKGVAVAITVLAKAIAEAAKTIAAAAPEILIAAAVALVIYAGFKAIGALFKAGGKKTKNLDRILSETRDKMYQIYNELIGTFRPVLTVDMQSRLDDQTIKLNWMVDILSGILGYITAIKDYIGNMNGTLDDILKQLIALPKAQHGGYFDRPTLAMIGEAGPEYVIPANQMVPAMAFQGAGGGGGQGGKSYGDINIPIHNEWNISGQAAMSPDQLAEAFDRNVNEMTKKIKGYLDRY